MVDLTDDTAPRRTAGLLAAAGLLVATAACNTSDLEPLPGEQSGGETTRSQQLGESTLAYSFDGVGGGAIPSYQERVAMHLLNRFRLDPAKWNLKPPMSNRPYPPNPPMVYDESVSEAGRWQGQHGLQMNCFCPTSPMAGPPAFNTCCDMARVDGKVQCVSPKVECDAEMATEEADRWKLLNRGKAGISFETYINQQLPPDQAVPALPGEIIARSVASGGGGLVASPQSNAFGIAQVVDTITPEKCKPPKNPCSIGTCTNPANGNTICDKENNPSCEGACKGPECGGICKVTGEGGEQRPLTCTLPEPPDMEECQPQNYPKGYYVSLLQASTSEPLPTLTDGIHMKLGATVDQMNPKGLFGITPPKETEFSIHYYEPQGAAQRSKLVVDGKCRDLSVTKRAVSGQTVDGHGDAGDGDAAQSDSGQSDIGQNDSGQAADTTPGMDTSTPDPSEGYYGLRYGTSLQLQPGCHRYVFSFVDADGFEHTYPSHGSLGAKIEQQQTEDGDTIFVPVENDDACPIWSPTRPDLSCLPKGNQCIEGESRPCYTGRDNTRGQGICKLGSESCKNGRWSGTCENQVTPEAEETCGDGKDNDCNGFVDEGCGGDGPDAGSSSGGTGDPDAGTGSGGSGSGTGGTGDPDAGSGSGGSGSGGSGSGTGGTNPDAGTSEDGGGPLVVDPPDDDGGCGCNSTSGSDGHPAGHLMSLLGFLFGLGWLRRRV